jgi:parvulin-like peptidyl-prolyl isomerase
MTLHCLLSMLLLGVGLAQAEVRRDEGPAAARVNGQVISEFRLERYFAEYLQAQGRALGSIRNPKAYRQLRQAALGELIDKELLWQEAGKRGVQIDDRALQGRIDEVRQAFGSQETFARRLEEAGFDEPGFAEYTRREMAAQQVYGQLSQVPEPDPQQVRALFEANREAMAQPERIQARHILLKVPQGADAAQVEATRQRLLALRQQITQGAEFATVAKAASEDSTASDGGDLGYFSQGRMVAEFEAAAFALKPGELSAPVRSLFGWHLIYLQNHLPAVPVEETQGLAMARAFLGRQQQAQARQQALTQLRTQNRIERMDDD